MGIPPTHSLMYAHRARTQNAVETILHQVPSSNIVAIVLSPSQSECALLIARVYYSRQPCSPLRFFVRSARSLASACHQRQYPVGLHQGLTWRSAISRATLKAPAIVHTRKAIVSPARESPQTHRLNLSLHRAPRSLFNTALGEYLFLPSNPLKWVFWRLRSCFEPIPQCIAVTKPVLSAFCIHPMPLRQLRAFAALYDATVRAHLTQTRIHCFLLSESIPIGKEPAVSAS